MRCGSRRGVTLIEVVIAVTLLSVLSVAMLFAMRIGLDTFGKVGDKLMANRRVAGAQRILESQIEGMMPVVAPCLGGGAAAAGSQKLAFFQGDSQTMRFVSTFSLQEAWRGQPRILEFAVIPGDNGRGVRLIVNELRYTGPTSAGLLCAGYAPGLTIPRVAPVQANPQSFVLADQLQYCRLSYLSPPAQPGLPQAWSTQWTYPGWPAGVRVDMAPLEADPSRLQPVAVTAPVRLHLNPGLTYGDL